MTGAEHLRWTACYLENVMSSLTSRASPGVSEKNLYLSILQLW